MGWYKNLKIGKKLFFAFLLLMVFLLIVGYLGIDSTGKIQGNLKETATVRLPGIDFLIQADRDLQQLLVAERSMIFSNAQSEVFQTLIAEYELGELSGWFNQFIEQIHDIISRVKNSTVRLIDSTEKISEGSGSLATRTSEQAASITQTSTTLEEFTAILKANSENSGEADKILESFNADVQAKTDLINNVTSTMKEIEASSKRIDDIVNVINDISFQTNLLALNAAVEAARAGEAGRGFAVVASEVRNLAQKTAESSKNIQDIVTRNVESTTKGTQLVGETSEFFSSIASVVADISGKVQEISNSSREQFTGVEQINEAISQLEGVINQNAAMVDDFADNSNVLISSSNELKELVARFKVESSGGAIPKEKKKEVEAKAGEPPARDVHDDDEGDEGGDFFGSGEEGFEEF